MDFYAIGDAAARGVILMLFAFCLYLILRVLRWLWRRITGTSVSGIATTAGVVAGKVDETARRFADGFREGFKRAKD